MLFQFGIYTSHHKLLKDVCCTLSEPVLTSVWQRLLNA